VLKEYSDQVRVVYKNFPLSFHKWAESAGIAGECAYEQDESAFWVLYNYFFDNQQRLNPDNLKGQTIEALGGTSVDVAKWTDCFDNRKTQDRVRADMTEGQSVGVTGTPAFLINGRFLSGAQPFPKFKAIIDDELQRAGAS
jgi:protein-disulfide isomerase